MTSVGQTVIEWFFDKIQVAFAKFCFYDKLEETADELKVVYF